MFKNGAIIGLAATIMHKALEKIPRVLILASYVFFAVGQIIHIKIEIVCDLQIAAAVTPAQAAICADSG